MKHRIALHNERIKSKGLLHVLALDFEGKGHQTKAKVGRWKYWFKRNARKEIAHYSNPPLSDSMCVLLNLEIKAFSRSCSRKASCDANEGDVHVERSHEEGGNITPDLTGSNDSICQDISPAGNEERAVGLSHCSAHQQPNQTLQSMKKEDSRDSDVEQHYSDDADEVQCMAVIAQPNSKSRCIPFPIEEAQSI